MRKKNNIQHCIWNCWKMKIAFRCRLTQLFLDRTSVHTLFYSLNTICDLVGLKFGVKKSDTSWNALPPSLLMFNGHHYLNVTCHLNFHAFPQEFQIILATKWELASWIWTIMRAWAQMQPYPPDFKTILTTVSLHPHEPYASETNISQAPLCWPPLSLICHSTKIQIIPPF